MMLCCMLLAPAFVFADDAATSNPVIDEANDMQIAAIKSFGAWYFKNGSKYPDFDAAWEGWLIDPAVPLRFKEAGITIKSKIQANIESIKQGASDVKRQTEDQLREFADSMGEALQKARDNAQSAFDKWLNDAITGSDSSNNSN